MPLCGSILQAGTCQILSLTENPRWSRVWQNNPSQKVFKASISISFVWECQEREKNVGATSSYKCCLLNQLYDQQSMSYPHKLRPNYEGVRGVRILDIEGSNLKKMCQAVIYFCQSIQIQGKINPINNIIGSLSIRNY